MQYEAINTEFFPASFFLLKETDAIVASVCCFVALLQKSICKRKGMENTLQIYGIDEKKVLED